MRHHLCRQRSKTRSELDPSTTRKEFIIRAANQERPAGDDAKVYREIPDPPQGTVVTTKYRQMLERMAYILDWALVPDMIYSSARQDANDRSAVLKLRAAPRRQSRCLSCFWGTS